MNKLLLTIALASVLLTACAADKTPLVFTEQRSVGIQVGSSPQTGGIDLSLGYKKNSLAIMPVVTPDGKLITGTDDCQFNPDGTLESCVEDTFSVLGQFEADVGNNHIGLGEFFATGFAARFLAIGFMQGMQGDDETPE